jgi:hypothetical protein
MKEVTKGDVCLDIHGQIALICRTNVQSEEPDAYGRIFVYHVGTVLKSDSQSVGSRWAGQDVRIICHISDLLSLAADSGYDLQTKAELPDSSLTEVQLLQRQVAQLQTALQQKNVVERPRSGIAPLQPRLVSQSET